MAYGECKIYNDGSHYIAIPHTTRPSRKRPKAPEEEIEVIEPTKAQEESSPSNIEGEPFELEDNVEEMKTVSDYYIYDFKELLEDN